VEVIAEEEIEQSFLQLRRKYIQPDQLATLKHNNRLAGTRKSDLPGQAHHGAKLPSCAMREDS